MVLLEVPRKEIVSVEASVFANVAAVRAVAKVAVHMVLEVPLRLESLRAKFALVGSFVGVGLQMLLQVASVLEAFGAIGALVLELEHSVLLAGCWWLERRLRRLR